MKQISKVLIIVTIIIITMIGLKYYFFTFYINSYDSIFVMYTEDNKVNKVLVSKNDAEKIKGILNKRFLYNDNPSCGFTKYDSIKIIYKNGNEITICPACDNCSSFYILELDKYISTSKEDRLKLNEILKKYGLSFPKI